MAAQTLRRTLIRLPFAALLVVGLSACSNEGGCQSSAFVPQPFPAEHYDKMVVGGAQVRISSHGLDFLETQAEPLIDRFVPGGLDFCVPKQEDALCYQGETCTNGADGCQVAVTLDDVQFEPAAPNRLNLVIDVGDLDEEISFRERILGINVACRIDMFKRGDNDAPGSVLATVPLNFVVDNASPTQDIRIDVGDITLDTTNFDFALRGGVGCGVANVAVKVFAEGLVLRTVTAELNKQVQRIVRSFTCQTCDDGEGNPLADACPIDSTCQEDDEELGGGLVCTSERSEECIPTLLGIEGRFELGALAGNFVEEPEAALDLSLRMADQATANTGLTLGARTGFQPLSFSRCVPVDPTQRPALSPVPISTGLNQDTTPDGDPFMVGIGIHKRALEHAFWSAWASGAICINVDSSLSDMLSTLTLGAFIPSLAKLADRKNRKVMIQLVPQSAPTITLGSNQLTPSGNSYTIDDPLLTLELKDFDINIFAWVMDRFTRVATLRTDLALPVAMTVSGEGELTPIIGDVANAFTNIRAVRSELLSEDEAKLRSAVETLLSVAVPFLSDVLNISFALPEFFGYALEIDESGVTSVDNFETVAVFANFRQAPMMGMMNATPLRLDVLEHRVDPHLDSSQLAHPILSLQAAVVPAFAPSFVDRSDFNPAAFDVEYSYRVNQGFWSIYERFPGRQSTLHIQDPVFRLQGEHHVEIRARYRQSSESRWRTTPTAMRSVTIDYHPPELSLRQKGQTVIMDAYDAVAPVASLKYRYRTMTSSHTSTWTRWSSQTAIELGEEAILDAVAVEVQVRDPAAHVANARIEIHQATHYPSATGSERSTSYSQSQAGCSQASVRSNPNTGGNAWLLLVLGGLLALALRLRPSRPALAFASTKGPESRALNSLLRSSEVHPPQRHGSRSKRGFLGALAIIAFGLLSACSDDTSSTNNADPCRGACSPNELCQEGQCVARGGCGTGPACSSDQICVAGRCQAPPTPPCTEDADCQAQCGARQGVCVDSECACEDFCAAGCDENSYCCESTNMCQAFPDPCGDQECEPGFGPEISNRGTADPQTCEVSGATCACTPLPPLHLGQYGRYLDSARGDDTLVVSAYNETYTDLMVGVWKGALSEDNANWYFVDGVPQTGTIAGALDGPRQGIEDPGPDVGSHTALALDPEGRLHIFYRDNDADALKYAQGLPEGESYRFEITVFDDQGEPGYWPQALHADGQVHLVYRARQVESDQGSSVSQIRYAAFADNIALSELETTTSVVAEGPAAQPCPMSCSGSAVCDAEQGTCATATEDCPSTCPSGTACIDASCRTIHNRNAPSEAEQGVGLFMDLSSTPDGLLLVFYNGTARRIQWVRNNASDWGIVDGLSEPSGPYGSGFIDATNNLHLAWMDTPNRRVLYQVVGQGQPEVIVGGRRDAAGYYIESSIGDSVQIGQGSDGNVEVVFQDATLHRLVHARRVGANRWNQTILATPETPYSGAHGFYADLVRTTGGNVAAEYVINNQSDPPSGFVALHELP